MPDNVRRLCYHQSLDKDLRKLIDEKTSSIKFPKFGVPTLQSVWVRLPKLLQHLDLPELEYEQELEEDQVEQEEQEEQGEQGEQGEQEKQKQGTQEELKKGIYLEQQEHDWRSRQSEQFQCLACPQQVTLFPTFPALEEHFLSVHKVQDLLGSPASSAVLLPSTLAIFTCKLCSQGECLGEQEVRDHLGATHGDFFLNRPGSYVLCCR